MRPIRLISAGKPDRALLGEVRSALARELATTCALAPVPLDPSVAWHPERSQYHSTMLLEQLVRQPSNGEISLAVTDLDLFIPILTFVFGEAQLGGSVAIVSYHRLQQEFYGLPRDYALLGQRLVKEAIHETGHVLGLTHCDDYDCVMAASHSVEWLDVKGQALCRVCRSTVAATVAQQSR